MQSSVPNAPRVIASLCSAGASDIRATLVADSEVVLDASHCAALIKSMDLILSRVTARVPWISATGAAPRLICDTRLGHTSSTGMVFRPCSGARYSLFLQTIPIPPSELSR
jgi:hypothetical protein